MKDRECIFRMSWPHLIFDTIFDRNYIVNKHAIDNYFVEPNVIGGEVRLTVLSTILAIFIGGILWGVAGMILFIPMLSILKIIFNHVEELKPYGYVLGNEGKSPSSKIMGWFRRKP